MDYKHPTIYTRLNKAINIAIALSVFLLPGCVNARQNPIETSVGYFIMSERQDAFDQLCEGFVRSISPDKAEIVFRLDAGQIKNLNRFKPEELVRVFYKKGLMPITARNIVAITSYGQADTEAELFELDHYIEGHLEGTNKRKIRVLFDVVDGLTYMPGAILPGDCV
ncbi:MAG: hypothetical protein PHY56_07740, partial [Candidatus Omnitrophica bacterium]|nr:hypothetical protein [Candidatus Omnitrophota bacterium]